MMRAESAFAAPGKGTPRRCASSARHVSMWFWAMSFLLVRRPIQVSARGLSGALAPGYQIYCFVSNGTEALSLFLRRRRTSRLALQVSAAPNAFVKSRLCCAMQSGACINHSEHRFRILFGALGNGHAAGALLARSLTLQRKST